MISFLAGAQKNVQNSPGRGHGHGHGHICWQGHTEAVGVGVGSDGVCALTCPACRKYFPLHFPQKKKGGEKSGVAGAEKPQRTALCQCNKSLRVNCAAQKTRRGLQLQAAAGPRSDADAAGLISWERSHRGVGEKAEVEQGRELGTGKWEMDSAGPLGKHAL